MSLTTRAPRLNGSVWLAAALVASAAAGVEYAAARGLRSASRCADRPSGRCHRAESIAVDAGGLRLRRYALEERRIRLNAEELVVRPSLSGVRIRAHALRGVLELDRPADSERREPSSRASTATPTSSSRPWWSRIPIVVQAPDGIVTAHKGLTDVTVVEPFVRITSEQVRLGGRSFALAHDSQEVSGVKASLAISRASPRRWSAHGQIDVGEGLTVQASGLEHRARMMVDFTNGGRATMDVTDVRAPATGLAVEAVDVPLAPVWDLIHPWLDGADLDVLGGRFGGRLRLSSGDSRTLIMDGVELSRLRIQSRHVARGPIETEQLTLAGSITTTNDRGTVHFDVQHGPLSAALSGHWDLQRWNAWLEVAPIECQDLLDAMPHGLFDVLEGTQLTGRVDARAQIELEPGRTDPKDDTTPGQLTVDFPFLDRCEVVSDPAIIDLNALRGPYRHRFRTDRGTLQERLLAPGMEGFAPLSSVPLLAKAFITLEDSRFYRHDGFDREQMKRAFWHNIERSRISRGASTITQQTARNLWLGGDRSLGRKLQEAFLATRLENRLSKTRIIEIYLNIIELGPAIYGVDEAARYHFGRSPQELDVLEAVFIASLAPAPRALSRRFADGTVDDEWMDHLHQQVRRMYMHHLITHDQLIAGLRRQLDLINHTAT